jgi:hypothetical protein
MLGYGDNPDFRHVYPLRFVLSVNTRCESCI